MVRGALPSSLRFGVALTGLGMYHFLQDSSFLPSNVANVAMLWGVYLWVRGQLILMAALAKVDGNAKFAERYWPLRTKWAEYLRDKGMAESFPAVMSNGFVQQLKTDKALAEWESWGAHH